MHIQSTHRSYFSRIMARLHASCLFQAECVFDLQYNMQLGEGCALQFLMINCMHIHFYECKIYMWMLLWLSLISQTR